MRKIWWFILVTVLLLPSYAAAQSATISILVQEPSSAGEKCGLQESSLRSIATLTLRNNRVSVGESFRYVYIATTAVNLSSGLCAVNLKVAFSAMLTKDDIQRVLLGNTFSPRNIDNAFFSMCERETLLTGSSSDMGRRVLDQVESKIKICLGELNY